MKYIIDIPEEYYKICKEWKAEKVATIEQAIIADGKPYEERPHGEWERTDNRWGAGTWRCTHCNSYYDIDTNYCPYCGASMKKEGEKE